MIAPKGKICSIVETDQKIDLSLLQQKSAAFVWEFMFTRSLFETEDMIEQYKLLTELKGLIETGTIKTSRTETLTHINAANLREAHRMVESGKMIGKVTLESFG